MDLQELKHLLKGVAVYANVNFELREEEFSELPLSILGFGKTDLEELGTTLCTDYKVNLHGKFSLSTTVGELLKLVNQF